MRSFNLTLITALAFAGFSAAAPLHVGRHANSVSAGADASSAPTVPDVSSDIPSASSAAVSSASDVSSQVPSETSATIPTTSDISSEIPTETSATIPTTTDVSSQVPSETSATVPDTTNVPTETSTATSVPVPSSTDVPPPQTPGGGQLQTIQAVISAVTSAIQPIADQIQSSATSEAGVTVQQLMALLGQIKDQLSAAVDQIQGVTSNPMGTAFVAEGQALSIVDLANTIGSLFKMVVPALGAAMSASGQSKDTVVPMVTDIGTLLTQLVTAVMTMAGGLMAALMPIIGPIVPMMQNLNMGSVAHLFGIM
ncbi:hypothetical protein AMATHDRAFT_4747 [Amanita thiersii Skay4041]|uniref:Uncharacterized protein n=1 Tax=Amanita thiersii Skay4041 TaxID=703135 RepID=A0A2A9NPJ0_9AGAR|nr:hypothetical protein AMATHDRAFT_4747 [Amanita thiersii Skay4041]